MNIYQNTKFKTIILKVKFSEYLNYENATKRSLLANVLLRGSKNYPNQKIISDALGQAYGADINSNVTKKGMLSQLDFTLTLVHPNYIKDENYLKDLITLFNDMILNPLIEEGFNDKYVKQEKEEIRFELESLYDDKMGYASLQSNELTDQNHTFSIATTGYLEQIDAISNIDLYEYYKFIFEQNNIDIYITGEIDENMENEIKSLLHIPEQCKFEINNTIKLENEILKKSEVQDIAQAKMHLVFNVNTTFKDEDFVKMQVFNDLMGGYSHSLFFQNIREKHSLAYYIASRYNSFLGLIYVYAGINITNYEKTKNLVFDQLTMLQTGTFEIEDLEKTKNMIINSYQESLDTQSAHINFAHTFQMYNNVWSLEKIIAAIKEVNVLDIQEMAKKMELKSIYVLGSEELNL